MMQPAMGRECAPTQVGVASSAHVVTVTHNSVKTVEAWLGALVASAPHIAVLTVVDNASTDGTVDLLRSLAGTTPFPMEVIENENSGFAGGYAAAACSIGARGVPVLCLNPDVILASDGLEALLDVLDSFPDAAVVTTPLVESDGSPDSASRRTLPTLGSSMLYSVLGRITPARFRYNNLEAPSPQLWSKGGRPVSRIEATTGAMMLVHPGFRTIDDGLFDRDYWMYGEDLQLCADARAQGRAVLMAEVGPSVHIKGISSGRPRSRRSNRAFHDAMLIYTSKNLLRARLPLALLAAAVELHFHVQELTALPTRLRRVRDRRSGS